MFGGQIADCLRAWQGPAGRCLDDKPGGIPGAAFGTGLAGGVVVPLSTFSTPDELEYLLAASACSILLLERQVLKKNFARLLAEIEPAIATTSEGPLVSLKFPFLRVIAMIDAEKPQGFVLS